MSTKIYNGFKFKKTPTLFEIKELASRFRAIIVPIVLKKVNTVIAWKTVCQIDRESLLGKPQKEWCNPLISAITEFEERERKVRETNRRDPLVDMEFNVCILPTKDQTYGIVYTEQNDLLEMWLEQKEIVWYPYWDNTDPMEGISWEDWEERGKEWDQALEEGYGIPSQNGMTIEFIHRYSFGMPTADDVLACMPSLEERQKYWIKELSLDHAEKQIEQIPGSPWRTYNAAKEWLKTDAGKQYLEEIAELVKTKLVPDVTKKMILEGVA